MLAESLPVYKASYGLTLMIFHVVKKYSKEFKYTLGEQIKKDSLALIATVYRANILLEKGPIIQEARGYLQSLRVLLRLSKDLHIINIEKFIQLQESIEVISKQLVAREKSQKTKLL